MDALPIISAFSFCVAAFSAHQMINHEPHRRWRWQAARFVSTVLAVGVTTLVVWN